MPKAKYEPICEYIRSSIENGEYSYGQLLPSENQYAARFSCTRNTIRRALFILTAEDGRGRRHLRRTETADPCCPGDLR